MSARRLLLGSAFVLLAVAALALVASPASAVIYKDGDWVVNGPESYSNEVIIVNSTAPNNGNVIVSSLGVLTLDNVHLILPFNRTFDHGGILTVRNSTLDGANWFFYIHGPALFEHTVIQNATHQASGGFSGTYIAESDVHFDDVSWARAYPRSSAYRNSIIHIKVVLDFQNVILTPGTEVYYELSPVASGAQIDVSNITFEGSTGMGYRTTFFTVTAVTHPSTVIYEIHDINITDPNDGIDLRASSTSTLYNLYNITIQGQWSSGIEVGDVGQSRFGGQIALTNVTVATTGGFGGGTRAFRIFGTTAAQISVDRLTVTGGGRGIMADGCTVQVTDSTFANGGYQLYADDNSHIIVYRTADNPTLSFTGSNAAVEHMAFLNIVAITWQGGVPFQGDLLQLRDAAGGGNLDIDPSNWSARFSVWWGRYSGQGLFDNRDLRPRVVDGTRQFSCSPSQFYFTESMGPLSITCTDDWGPTMSVSFPRSAGVVNQSTFAASGSVIDLGSGLASLGYSFDNITYTPIALPTNGTNWTAPLVDIADASYYLYTRAVDRVGQTFYVRVGPFLVDTSPPDFTLPVPPEYVSGSNFTLDSFAEPQAKMSFSTITGLTGNTTVNGAGEWRLVLPLTEGLNVFTITAVDQAGNRVTQVFSLVVDHTPPALTVLLDPVTYTATQTLVVAGLAEANAAVVVNSIAAPRTGENFQLGVLLAPGPNNIVVVATDGAGNIREWMGVAIYDNAIPDLSVVVSTGATSGGVHVTGKATVPVAGQVTDALTEVAWLSVNGVQYTFDDEGVFFVALNLTEGTQTFTVMAADLVGNTARYNFTVLRDSTPPQAEVAVVSAGAPILDLGGVPHTSETSVTIVVTMSESGTVTLNGASHSAVAGENNYIVTLVEGQNDFRLNFRDSAGNAGSTTSLAVVRDTVAPAIALTKPTNGQVIIADSFTVEGTTQIGATVTINGEEVPVSPTGAFSKTLPLTNGTVSVTVEATDELGNADNMVLSVTRGEERVQVEEPAQDFTLPVVFLAVGVVGGVAVGFMLRARGSSAMRRELEDAEGGAGPPTGPGMAQGPAPPPKGPRGPQPPGGM